MPRYNKLTTIQEDLANGLITCEHLVEYYLDRINATKALNVYIEVFEEEVMAQAKALDAKYKNDPASVGKLFGMVLSLSKMFCATKTM